MTVVAPVSVCSLCVTPCGTRSPMTTSRIMSNGSIELSSRRPTARVTTKISTKTKTGRKTRSTGSSWGGPLGQDGDRGSEAGDRPLGVVELDRVRTAPDVRRVHLELEPDAQHVAGLQRVVAQHDAPVAAGLADRRRLDRVDLHALDPAAGEHDARVVDRLPRADLDARLEEQAAADPRRRVEAHRGRRRARDGRRRTLAVA